MWKTRFWVKVDKGSTYKSPNVPTNCWQWTAALKKPENYGFFKLNRKMVYAHRLAYEHEVEPVPDGMQVLHRCDNPSCVRPGHLFLGTVADNMRDRNQKGRQASGKRNGKYTKPENTPRGERHHKARLTAGDVREIRRRAAAGETQSDIGAAYGVAQQHIGLIVNRKSWRHVE